MMMKKLLAALLALLLLAVPAISEEILVEDGVALTETLCVEYGYRYSSPEEVALYLHVFRQLPINYITKSEAYDYGWVPSKGNLWEIMDDELSIGGDVFGNREGILPKGHWYECDVNYEGGFRGEERLLFSDNGEIYYTGNHYRSAKPIYDGWFLGEVDYGEWIYDLPFYGEDVA